MLNSDFSVKIQNKEREIKISNFRHLYKFNKKESFENKKHSKIVGHLPQNWKELAKLRK